MKDVIPYSRAVEEAQQRVDKLRGSLGQCLRSRRVIELKEFWETHSKRRDENSLWLRTVVDQQIPRSLAVFILLVAILVACLAVLMPFGTSLTVALTIGGTTTLLAGGLIGPRLLIFSDKHLLSRIGERESRINALRDSKLRAIEDEARAASALSTAQAQWERAQAAFHRVAEENKAEQLANDLNYQRNLLLSSNWQVLTGGDFEAFLDRVFRLNGFQVQRTGKTGDQGVDLIVERHQRRLAVQAKGYPNSTVSNSAVQEAHTGRDHYRCQIAIVVTNSTFTKSAKELASSVGCVLVDHATIADLIFDRLRLT